MNGLNSSSAMIFGSPHWCSRSSGRPRSPNGRNSRRACRAGSAGTAPCLPFSMSESDLSGRLLAPVMTLPRRPLSNSASTASCSIRFSLRMMMSGACSSMNRFSRLLRLMTRRYRSFRSEVAKRPPSSGTSGRRSGGMTGTTSASSSRACCPNRGRRRPP